ncbi:MAG: (E)-4-hydroxy-3-methylbut-2-enyl-diphosphate synthase [Candidatus Omnitrophica bacterium]|nr:(E)-4-hydroxy-3-methylbut-2-enyl-diphosphate synthase [Candidatus Omnitrophota bacterium]
MSRTVSIGPLKVGGKNPVRIKGMLKGRMDDWPALRREAKRLEREGAEAIRIAVKHKKDSAIAGYIKKRVRVPLVADIHFQHRLALQAIEQGFDGIRLNPLNITGAAQVREVARAAKQNGVSIRVGVNSGGFRQGTGGEGRLARQMVAAVSRYIKLLEKEHFFDIMVSLKASTVPATVKANRLFRDTFQYPLHLGVTASGPFLEGVVKSSLGIGMLLAEGIGEVIRVSLTGPSFWEIRVAKSILQSLGRRHFYPEIISCPTCSRCQVNLVRIVDRFRNEVNRLQSQGVSFPKKIALMGCEVNGPGEAAQAEVGVAFGKGRGVIFRKNKIIGTIPETAHARDILSKMGVL